MSELNFISINVKCPVCNKSLMDAEKKVDNEPSIKLNINFDNTDGNIWLSSVYGSSNYVCDIDMLEHDIATFFCPHCKSEVNAEYICDVCGAPLVSLNLDMGGRVSFCSRKGCQNHSIGFEDLSDALKKFYTQFGYNDKVAFSAQQRLKIDKLLAKEIKSHLSTDEEHKEIIESGSYLMSYCPHCLKSLLEDDLLKLKIINENNKEGFVMLSPYLNVFSSKSTVYLPEDKVVKDLKCFHCNKSLMVDDTKCETCGSAVARFMVSVRTKMIHFYICSKKGCRWHGVNKDDMNDIRLEDSIAW